MAANIEIKARVKDFDGLARRAEALSDTPAVKLQQEDTFFNTLGGRLKLRVLAPDHGELIYYTRDDATGPKRSDYLISMTPEPEALKTVLAAAWGIGASSASSGCSTGWETHGSTWTRSRGWGPSWNWRLC